jgi:hypothetical protein
MDVALTLLSKVFAFPTQCSVALTITKFPECHFSRARFQRSTPYIYRMHWRFEQINFKLKQEEVDYDQDLNVAI